MKTTTFKRLLAEGNEYGVKEIVIPRIQRAYAQGRPDSHATKTRDRFLKSIHEALSSGRTLTLDFVYGNVKEGTLVPLDGQQRLTTLWLLHWYAAKREGLDTDMLARFSYHTRYSARDFLRRLNAFDPDFGHGLLSEKITRLGWYPMEWNNDPTVSSMLRMLDDIDARFADIDGLWQKLDLVEFYFLSIDEMQLTDDIYIKMNSRGKPLTEFEHFKAEFLKVIRDIEGIDGEAAARRIGLKIDTDWTDMLWPYRGSDNIIDDEFLRYFLLVCHLITYRHDRSATELAKLDSFGLVERLFTGPEAAENLAFLEDVFDCWAELARTGSIAGFFADYLSASHEAGKAMPLTSMRIDLLGACLARYPFENSRPNSQQWLVTLYAFIVFLLNRGKVSDADFRRRLRIVLNLQKNSGNEVVDTPNGDAGNRMPAVLAQVERIILEGRVDPVIEIGGSARPNFSVAQLDEERAKLDFTNAHPEHAEPLFALEDHELLYGRTAVVGHENPELYSRFHSLFADCSRDSIDRALLALSDYWQRRNNWCVQLGSGSEAQEGTRAWFELFHPSVRIEGFDRTCEALRTLLADTAADSDEALDAIAEAYLERCRAENRYDWRYYYIAYEDFRARRYGKYTLFADTPYELVTLYAEKRESSKAYQCFLACLGDDFADVRSLNYDGAYLWCEQDAFVLYNDDDEEIARLEIPQIDGIDTVDRIQLFKENPL